MNDLPPLHRAGIHALPPGGLPSLQTAAAAAGLDVYRIELAGCADKAALLRAIAQALHFPPWFGHNWDALADCLADLSWLDTPQVVAALCNPDTLQHSAPEDYHSALEIFAEAAASLAAAGRTLSVFIPPPVQHG